MQEYNETGLKSFKTARTREGKQAEKGGQPAEKHKLKEGGVGDANGGGDSVRLNEGEREERRGRDGGLVGS